MKILIGVDESPCSDEAVDYVRRMPWQAGTEILVMSVAQNPMLVGVEPYASSVYGPEMLEAEIEKHRKIVARAEEKLRDTGAGVTGRVDSGDARIELIDTAAREKSDLIVVGSHGRSGLSKLLMGSVASHIVTHAPCSVLVVKKPTPR
jgi:nucleotide-binding universal stress UspA family protein